MAKNMLFLGFVLLFAVATYLTWRHNVLGHVAGVSESAAGDEANIGDQSLANPESEFEASRRHVLQAFERSVEKDVREMRRHLLESLQKERAKFERLLSDPT